ncbi:hypothetical protein ACSAZK_03605 [Methanosarcina sp. Mfa9]|uniref:hypothetical protein n=1 Tax=Methanosarcina sp. Mfa9 TaxID=3439063 RepID=UPI003F82EF2E
MSETITRRLGTTFSAAEFDPAHRAGIEAETTCFSNVIGDLTLRFDYEEERLPNGTLVFAFRSRKATVCYTSSEEQAETMWEDRCGCRLEIAGG